jgi:hypothetical protein
VKPVDQTILHNPAQGRYGDCFRACIASILHLPAQAVPHVFDGASDDDTAGDGLEMLNQWLAQYGLAYTEVLTTDPLQMMARYNSAAYHVMVGRSPRGGNHAVVAKAGKVVHDPHPERGGLSKPLQDGYWAVGVVSVCDPEKLILAGLSFR